jgi:transposase
LRLYRRLNTATSLAFPAELRRAFPFAVRLLHEFALAVEAAGMRHRYLRPRRPQQNGKVERSHRIHHEEFWSRHRFPDFETAGTALRGWETQYDCLDRAEWLDSR